MKIVKWIAAALLGLSVQGVLADQVSGTVLYVGAVPSGFPDTPYKVFFSLDPESENFTDWDLGEEEHPGYAVNCLIPYVGWPVFTTLSTDEHKQAMALLASANATGQEIVVFYHTVSNAGTGDPTPSGLDCILDGVMVAGAGADL